MAKDTDVVSVVKRKFINGRIIKMRLFIFLLPLFIFSLLFPIPASAATDYWKHPGMMFRLWDQGDDYASTCPNCGPAGGIFNIAWSTINPGDENYNFAQIDGYLNKTKSMRTAPFPDGTTIPRPVIVGITISGGKNQYFPKGDHTPDWIYSGGVSRITDCNDVQIPNYGDNTWKSKYFALIRKLAEVYGANDQIAGFIFSDGYEEEAYITKGCSDFNVFGNKYDLFIRELAQTMGEAFRNKKPVYLPAGMWGSTPVVVEAALANGIGVKSNTLMNGTGFILYTSSSDGTNYWNFLGKKQNLSTGLPWSAAIKTSDQLSWAFEDAKPLLTPKDVYYQWLFALSFHPDWMDWRNFPALAEMVANVYPNFTREFVPTYLHKTKRNTPGAWVAFRRVQDESTYPNGDHELICWSGTCQTHVVNDLEFYLTKVGDNGSIKKFTADFPEPAKSQVYGFGRALDPGKYMAMKVEDGVWFRSGAHDISLKLILLNSGTGAIRVDLKKSDGSTHSETFTKGSQLGTNNSFVEIVRNISGVVFNGGLVDGGDVVVKSEEGQNIVHMLEIRPGGDIPVAPTIDPNAPTLSPTPSRTPTPSPTPNLSCICQSDNTCHSSCVYDKFATGITYSNPIRCSLPENSFVSPPSQEIKTNWCRNNLITKGDADNSREVNILDYYYFVHSAYGGTVSSNVNPDFNRNGSVDEADRQIIIKTLIDN